MPAPSAALTGAATVVNAGSTAAVLLAENAVSVHDPTDIALCGLNTRSMFRNRSGRPRSAVSSIADAGPPAAASHRASRARVPSDSVRSAIAPITAAAPAAPPTKKYVGTSHVHTGAFSSGASR